MRQKCICEAGPTEAPPVVAPDPLPSTKKTPEKAEAPSEIGGVDPMKANPDREETDSGFAQNDCVFHAKRGEGTVRGFYGEFVLVQFESEPHGQHKYTHEKARKVLVFSDGSGKPAADFKPKPKRKASVDEGPMMLEPDEDDEKELPSPSPIRDSSPDPQQEEEVKVARKQIVDLLRKTWWCTPSVVREL